MKKLSSVLLVFVLFFSFIKLTAIPANALTATIDGVTYTYTVTGTEATITKAVGSGDIIVPSTLGGSFVVAIGANAFKSRVELTSVALPEGIVSIGDDAFRNCAALKSITIPANVTSIGKTAFMQCTVLESVAILGTNVTIGEKAFNSLMALTSVSIGGGTIGNEAFHSCYNLASLTLGGVTSIGDGAFRRTRALASVTIPKTVTHIGQYAFAECYSVDSYTVDPDNPSYTGKDGVLFDKDMKTLIQYPGNRENLTYTVPAGVETIGAGAFLAGTDANNCHPLKEIILPDGLKTIEDNAFYYCSFLQNIDIPETVTSIGYRAFGECYRLKYAHISPSVVTIGNEAFWFANQACICYTEETGSVAENYAKAGVAVHGSRGYTGYTFGFVLCNGHETIHVRFLLDKDTPYQVDNTPYSWTVDSGAVLSSLATPLPESLPPMPDGSTFSHWEFIKMDNTGNVIERTRVDGTFTFDPEALPLAAAGTGYTEDYICDFYAVYTPRVIVRYYLDDGSAYMPDGNTPYTWNVEPGITVSDVTGAAPKPYPSLPGLPNKADGSTFSHWKFVLKDAEGNETESIKVGSDFVFDPAALNLQAVGKDYICDFYAVYNAPVPVPAPEPDPCEKIKSVLKVLLPVLGIGGVAIGVGGIVIGGLTLPWLIALPLLPIVFLAGKYLFKNDCAHDKCDQCGKCHKCEEQDCVKNNDDTKNTNNENDSDNEYVKPPKTGDNLITPFAFGTLGLLAAAVLVMLQRRRREERIGDVG